MTRKRVASHAPSRVARYSAVSLHASPCRAIPRAAVHLGIPTLHCLNGTMACLCVHLRPSPQFIEAMELLLMIELWISAAIRSSRLRKP